MEGNEFLSIKVHDHSIYSKKERDMLAEAVIVVATLHCSKCPELIMDEDPHDIADEALNKGWHITRLGNVYCPKCRVRKRKTCK